MFTILLPVVEDYREQWPPPEPMDSDDPLAKTVEEDEETRETDTDSVAPSGSTS